MPILYIFPTWKFTNISDVQLLQFGSDTEYCCFGTEAAEMESFINFSLAYLPPFSPTLM